jgi:hypothetical protein
VEAAAVASNHLVAEISVERDDDQPTRQRILDQGLIVLGLDARLARSDDRVASSVQQEHHRLDQVLVGQEG